MLSTQMFGEIFSLDRFMLILRFIHSAKNNNNQIPGDRLHKIIVIISTLKTKFADVFVPFEKICIDESIVEWKGRLSFKNIYPKRGTDFE